MAIDIDDVLGVATEKARRRPRTSRGPLHELLTKALPDLRHPVDGVCDLDKLAKALGMTHQGIYLWVKPGRPNRLSVAKAVKLVQLSKKQQTGDEHFKPVTLEEFTPFLT